MRNRPNAHNKVQMTHKTISTAEGSQNDSVEALCAALLYMMSYYPRSNDPQLATEIAKHLTWLEQVAKSKGCKALGETAHRLLASHWSPGQTVH